MDLSQTELVFVSPNAWEVSNVSVGGTGYSGTLEYAGDGKLQVTGISMVELPPTALEEAQADLAEVEAALAAAQAANDALAADNAALQADLADAQAMADDAQASADMSMADADMAMADLEAMIADAFQPSAIAISDAQIDPSRASFADAKVAIADPDAVYVSSIVYDGQRYSALLRYTGGTTADVKQIYGTAGKLIPDSVDLSQTELVFMAPNAWEVSNVSVGGVGYSGTLAYAGDGKLQVTGIRMVELPATALEEAQAALAEVEAALAAAQAENSFAGRRDRFAGSGSAGRQRHGSLRAGRRRRRASGSGHGCRRTRRHDRRRVPAVRHHDLGRPDRSEPRQLRRRPGLLGGARLRVRLFDPV